MRVRNVPVDGALPGGSLDIEQRSYDKGQGVPTGVLRISFDLYEPSSGSGRGFVEDLSDPGYLRLRGAGVGAGLHIIIIDDGEIQVSAGEGAVESLYTFGEDWVVRMDFVFNQSGDDATYRGSVLNSGKFAVYADNFLVALNIESGIDDPTDEIARILLRTQYLAGGTVAQELWIDNWETAAVPDAASEVNWVNISPRFGWINNVNAPWYFSQNHGWLYFTVGDSTFYYPSLLGDGPGGWMYMTDESYPFAYRYSLETWVDLSLSE
jgi:hypothetical protein